MDDPEYDIFQLLKAVKKHPILWQQGCRGTRAMRKLAWNVVAREMDLDGKFLVKSMRTTFI